MMGADGHTTARDGRLPVTLLTGFLGAGKTTLVNHILTTDHGRRYAVVVNEFGEIGIDNDLIVESDEELFQMSNGCICCTVRGDLIRTLRALLKEGAEDLDGVIIETTGLADPGPVIQTFFADQILAARARLDSVTTVVDAHHIRGQLGDNPEAVEQVAFADQIVLNKTDMAAESDRAEIEAALRRLNAHAPIHAAEWAAVDLQSVLGRSGFDLDRIERDLSADTHDHIHDEHCGEDHLTRSGIDSVALTSRRALDAGRLEAWIGDLLRRRGQDILRTKGIFDIAGENRKLVFQSVHMVTDGEYQSAWETNEERVSRMVFIGRRLDPDALRQGFDACAALN